MELVDVNDFILSRATVSDLEGITKAVKRRRETLGGIAIFSLKVGSRVRLHNISPKSFMGKTGTITYVKHGYSRTTFDIKLDSSVWRSGRHGGYYQDTVSVHAECVEAI